MSRKISTGVDFLDNMIGGYEVDSLTTVYGPAGMGKTCISLLAAVSLAKKGKKVVYIDTEGGFSVTRLKQLAKDHKKVLENVTFIRPLTFIDQKKAIEKLVLLLEKKTVHLIIVDTIGMLYRFERKSGEEGYDMTRELSGQIAKLMEITRKHKIPVLMTNQVYHDFKDQSLKMIGGDVLNYAPKCIMEIKPQGQHRKIVLHKHRSVPSGQSIPFKIVESGVESLIE